MKHLFFALYVILSVIHLVHSWQDDAKRRKYTKPFLLILLAAYYVCSTDNLSWPLLLALLTSWLGDVLLIPKGHKWFTMGGISFLASHFLFITVYVPSVQVSVIPWAFMLVMAFLYYGISLLIIRAVRKTTPKPMVVPMYLYLLANSTMNLFALMRIFSLGSVGSYVAYAGAVLFFISDCTLFLVRYYRNPDVIFKHHFTVMLTYLAGEFFIVLGILMG